MRHYCRQVLTSVGDAARRPFSRSGLSSQGSNAAASAGGSTPRSALFSRQRGNKVQPVSGPQGGAGGEAGPAQLLVIDESHAFKDSPRDAPGGVRQAWGDGGAGKAPAGAPAPGAAYAPRTQQTRTRQMKGPLERTASRAAV